MFEVPDDPDALARLIHAEIGDLASQNGTRPPPNQPDPDENEPGAWLEPICWPDFWNQDGPDIDWVIEPLIPRGRQVALYSPAKAGKSLLALELSAAAATGQSILGQPAVKPIRVVYIDMEMTEDDLRERLEAFGYGPDSDLDNLAYYLQPAIGDLDKPQGGQIIANIAAHHQADLVVIDTMARAVSGDENDADTYRDFYRNTGRILKAANIALLRLDHAGKDPGQGQRGSSSKNDDVDIVYRLAITDTGIILRRTHARISWVPAEIPITRTQHADTDEVRHELANNDWAPDTAPTAILLDELGVPLDATTRMAQDALKRAGNGRRRTVIISAMKYRRVRPRRPE